ncbi:transketolase family protein [Candidatus Dojkabacteria bacterium]|uniref:Transketolase family protein n=1 Tax=Candidatus Dojkabacteria bacterium TaxID=2099670 RepID=A0A955I8P6_9BACT|nr:transketolase family protein [Candidatus Dojkabacteria bacterium]
MIPDYKLQYNWQDKNSLEHKPTRDGYGVGLEELGYQMPDVVALSADLTESTRTNLFADTFPDRFFQTGIAEQNMMGIAAGLAINGKIPFAASYSAFSPGRNWDQLRVSVCYSKANVKVVSTHAGLTVGPDGATHQALEDIAITRVLPNLTVVVPSDYHEARKATHQIARMDGPVYMRLGRSKTPIYTSDETYFELGKANVLYVGTDVTVVACGIMVYEALMAANELAGKGISVEVINCHTIKPIDAETIVQSAHKTGAVVTAEEHQINGGLGGAVAEVLAEHNPVPMKRVGVKDTFGESGTPDELLRKYGVTKNDIVNAITSLI